MEVHLGLDGLPNGMANPVVTIGAFDGIHLGHQQLLERVRSRAAELDGSSVLVTFEPHPQRVIAPGTAPPLLTSREEKLPLLEAAGLDAVVILPFNRELSEMEAEDFVTVILKDAIGVRFLVLGHDHAFGKGRRGRPDLLRQMAPKHGFDLEVVEAVRDDGDPITSTLIRRHLQEGSVRKAADLLGRPYNVKGLVEKGDQRGREIGWPTANIRLPLPEKCLPGDGIYAVRTVLRNEIRAGACSVGVRPTFGNGRRTVEVYILDFEDDIYGESVEVRFHRRIRDERAFDGVESLVKQIERDVADTRRILAQEEH